MCDIIRHNTADAKVNGNHQKRTTSSQTDGGLCVFLLPGTLVKVMNMLCEESFQEVKQLLDGNVFTHPHGQKVL